MLMSNVHVNGDLVEAEDVDVGADGCVNVDVKVDVDVNVGVEVKVVVEVVVDVDVDVDVDIGKENPVDAVVDVGVDVDVDVDSDEDTDVDEKTYVARTRGDAEARILSRSWYPLCGAGKDAQPTQEAKQGEWRGAHSQHGAHVHE